LRGKCNLLTYFKTWKYTVSGLLITIGTRKTFLLNIEDFGNAQIELFIYQFHHFIPKYKQKLVNKN